MAATSLVRRRLSSRTVPRSAASRRQQRITTTLKRDCRSARPRIRSSSRSSQNRSPKRSSLEKSGAGSFPRRHCDACIPKTRHVHSREQSKPLARRSQSKQLKATIHAPAIGLDTIAESQRRAAAPRSRVGAGSAANRGVFRVLIAREEPEILLEDSHSAPLNRARA